MAYNPTFLKILQMELTAKKMWEFTDKVKKEIWEEKEWDDEIREGYRNNDGVRYGWELQAEPIIKGFERDVREHKYDQLDSRYIADRFAYNFWKQYEAEWNKKYKKL